MKKFILLFIALTVGLASSEEKTTKVPALFHCFQYAKGLKDVYVNVGPETYQKIELSTANLVGPVSVSASEGKLTIHSVETNSDGEISYPIVGSATLNQSTRPIIVMVPDSNKKKEGYGTLTLDGNRANFPLGSYQFVNLTAFPIRALIGQTRLRSKSGSVQVVRPKAAAGEMMVVLFEYNDGEAWRSMTKTRWASRPDRRSIICAYLDPKDQRVKMRSIPEREVPAI